MNVLVRGVFLYTKAYPFRLMNLNKILGCSCMYTSFKHIQQPLNVVVVVVLNPETSCPYVQLGYIECLKWNDDLVFFN